MISPLGRIRNAFARTALRAGQFFATEETLGGTRGPLDDFWYRPIGSRSSTGIAITPNIALEVSAVFACQKVISETLAMLPCVVYERLDETRRQRAVEHPVYRLVHEKPNGWQTPYDFKEVLTGWAAIHGNGYARKVFDDNGIVVELIPIHPSLVRIEIVPADNVLAQLTKTMTYSPDTLLARADVGSSLQLRYHVQMPGGGEKVYLQDEIFHLRGQSLDAISGVVISRHAREAIGLARAMESFGARFFANDSTVGMVLEHPGKLSKEALENLKSSFAFEYAGVQNAFKPKVLEEGMKLNRLQVNAGKDAQLVEARADQVVEIARFYRMPLHKIQHYLHATFSNVEQLAIEFVTDTMQPWAVRWEQAITRDLLPEKELFAEFLFNSLLRGDLAAKAAYYKERFYIGTLSRNDIRALENENPIPGGDTYYVNSATVPLDADGNPRPAEAIREVVQGAPIQQENTPPGQNPDPGQNQDERDTAAHAAFSILLADAADRILAAETRELVPRWAKRSADPARFAAWASGYYSEQLRAYAARTLTPVTSAWTALTGEPLSAEALADQFVMRSLRHVLDLNATEPTNGSRDWLCSTLQPRGRHAAPAA